MPGAQEASHSARIADFVGRADLSTLPTSVAALARSHLLDTLGSCVAAVGIDTSRALAGVLSEEGGAPQATAIGLSHALPASQAALFNGALARSLEYDDMAMPDLHPSGVIAPVALAVGEWQRAPGKEVLAAYALGLELCLRIGRAGYDPSSRSSRFLQRGQDSSAICGTVAGAAVAAKLFRLEPSGIADAIGIAVSFASGSLESNRSGGTIKRLQSGWAAGAAVRAACLARAGIEGPLEAFEGRYGFYNCFVDGALDAATLSGELGSRWEVLSLRIKPYPSNYYTHGGIDAALASRRAGIAAEQVVSAELAVATPMLRTMGEPLERKQAPRSAYEAKFSGPYTVAAALIGGSGLGLGTDDFSDALVHEPRRKALMRRIGVVADPRCDAVFPDQAPAILTIRTIAGRTVVNQVMVNRGSPDNPLDDAALATKFRDNCKASLRPDETDALRAAIEAITDTDVTNIAALLRSVGSR